MELFNSAPRREFIILYLCAIPKLHDVSVLQHPASTKQRFPFSPVKSVTRGLTHNKPSINVSYCFHFQSIHARTESTRLDRSALSLPAASAPPDRTVGPLADDHGTTHPWRPLPIIFLNSAPWSRTSDEYRVHLHDPLHRYLAQRT